VFFLLLQRSGFTTRPSAKTHSVVQARNVSCLRAKVLQHADVKCSFARWRKEILVWNSTFIQNSASKQHIRNFL